MAIENDVVLIYFEDKPLVFARIEEILPDIKPDWYHIKLLMLQVPLQVVTWILRDAYINGEEFTMNGKKMRLMPVKSPEEKKSAEEEIPESVNKATGSKSGDGKVISLSDLKKR